MVKATLRGLLIGAFLLHWSSAQTWPNFGRCTTPSREHALCIALPDCKYLFNLLLQEPLREEDRLYLSRSQCGYRNGQVLICCPDRFRQALTVVAATTKPPPAANRNSLLPRPGQCGNVLSSRIFGGNATKIDEFPWTALVEYTKPGGSKSHHCGGSLISARYVVTAAHCVNGKGLPADWKLSGVRLGEWDITTNPDCAVDVRGETDCAPEHLDVPVEHSAPHPGYNPSSKNQQNDIALLRLQTAVLFTDFIRPICLPTNMDLRGATFDGVTMIVAGWGKTENSAVSAIKLKATVEGIALDACRAVYMSQGILLENSQMCAGGREGIDSCRGDSGGPLIGLHTTNKALSYYFLAGIVSFGPTPCGLQGWPGVYTRVGDFVDWIKKTVQP